MRVAVLGLGLVAAAMLAVAPVMAQAKTKTKDVAPVANAGLSLELLELCELFANGDVTALSEAEAQGWSATETETDSVFVRSFDATRTVEGVGDIALFALNEDYPLLGLGYCRIDIASPESQLDIAALDGLDRLSGEYSELDTGRYGAWNGAERGTDYMLLANQEEAGFGLQLTILDPHTTP